MLGSLSLARPVRAAAVQLDVAYEPSAQITELELEDVTTNLACVDLTFSGDGGDD